jgi:hypothetical protein
MHKRTAPVVVAGLLAIFVAALAAAQAPARPTLTTKICGVGKGSMWTRAGHTGLTWAVVALDDNGQCGSARQWIAPLSARMTSRSGADVQAFRLLGDACVLTKSTLLAACRTGDGGPGSAGVAVIGDPTANPAARPFTGGRTSLPALPSSGGGGGSGGGPGASADGIPVPWAGTVDCRIPSVVDSAGWALALPDGQLIRGTKWFVRDSGGATAAACQALKAQWPDLTAAAGSARADHDSFETKAWIDGSWSCIVGHDVAWPGGGAKIASLTSGSCARIQYPGGGNHPILEQVSVMPGVENTTPATTVAERTALYAQARDLRDALDRYGVHAATAAALTAVRLNHVPPGATTATGTHPASANTVFTCGTTSSARDPSYRVLGAAWTHGSEHGSNWQVAVNGGYPCELARGLFLPWLADVLGSGTPVPAAQLSRYGWHCALQRAPLMATCHFTASGDPLRNAIGKPIPGDMTVGIRAAYTTGATRETLPNAVRAAS